MAILWPEMVKPTVLWEWPPEAQFLGPSLGVIILMICLPGVRLLLMYFGAQEYFWSVVVSLIIIALAGMGGSFLPGLVAGMIGLQFSFIGFSDMCCIDRFTLGSLYLWDGLPLIAIAIGVAAVSELTLLQASGSSIAKGADARNVKLKGVIKGAFEPLKYKGCLGRSSLVGTIIGIIPGLGSVAATFVSYSVAQFMSKSKNTFGHGNPEGLIASEASNNAKDAGAMLPSLFLGIPGSPEHAILLMIFIIYGIEPGPGMGVHHMDLVWTIILAITLSNAIACIIAVFGGKALTRITTVPITPVVAATIPLSMVAVYVTRNNPWDLIMTFAFVIFGIFLKRTGYPMGPFIVGFVLGPLLEKSFYMTLQSGFGQAIAFVQHPLAIILACVAVIGVLAPFIVRGIMVLKAKRLAKVGERIEVGGDGPQINIGKPGRQGWLLFSTILLVLSVLMGVLSPTYGLKMSVLPFIISICTAVLLIMLLLGELIPSVSNVQYRLLGDFAGRGEWRVKTPVRRIVPVMIWLFILFALFIIVGAVPAIFICDLFLLRFPGKSSWPKSVLISLVVYGRNLHSF